MTDLGKTLALEERVKVNGLERVVKLIDALIRNALNEDRESRAQVEIKIPIGVSRDEITLEEISRLREILPYLYGANYSNMSLTWLGRTPPDNNTLFVKVRVIAR